MACQCSVTPVPEPPNEQPKPPDLSQINGDVQTGIGTTPITLTGAPGSVEAGAVLWAVNLDAQDPPVENQAAADGSFQVTLPTGSIGQELRLQARQGDRRSDPVDALIVSLSGLLSPSSRQACLVFSPAFELGFGDVPLATPKPSSIAIHNSCSATVVVDSAQLRAPNPAFTLDTVLPLSIPPGSNAKVDVTFTPTKSGLDEEVLLTGVTGPLLERRPITEFGSGKP